MSKDETISILLSYKITDNIFLSSRHIIILILRHHSSIGRASALYVASP